MRTEREKGGKILKEKCAVDNLSHSLYQSVSYEGDEKLNHVRMYYSALKMDKVENLQQTGVAVHKTSCIYDRSSFILREV